MVNETYYLKIKGLMIPSQSDSKTIIASINNYIDKIENAASKLESALAGNKINDFVANMYIIQDMLKGVHAKRLIADASILLYTAENATPGSADYEKCKKTCKQFTVDLLTLSIEMQKAQNLAEKSTSTSYSQVEEHEEMARGLSTVGQLINAGNYDKAENLAQDLKISSIANEIKSRDYGKAEKLASAMQKEHIGYVNRVGGGVAGSLKKVMSVDDRPEIIASVNAALDGHYKVFGAPSGEMALKIMEQQQMDLFILDIDMPGMNGFELAERIQAMQKYSRTPILFLTATSSRSHIKKSMELDIRDFVVKPAYSETLLAKVAKYLN